ncbi:MAG: hypothetical protein CMP40_02885 [Rickettsiales bacterium]|nr:hypothetical protein [Rickettsiales bacterium]
MVKKIAYFFGILLLIGIIGQFFGLVEESSPTKFTEQQIAEREKLIAFWIDFQKKSNGTTRLELQGDTLVIIPLKIKENLLRDKKDLARNYHPKTMYNGATCSGLGIKMIQVRSYSENNLLSILKCEDN